MWLQFWKTIARYYLEAPHVEELSPAVIACHPRDARVMVNIGTKSTTDDHPSPRQEGYAWLSPWLGQVRDGAGIRGWGREQFNTWKRHDAKIQTAYHNLPWCRCLLLTWLSLTPRYPTSQREAMPHQNWRFFAVSSKQNWCCSKCKSSFFDAIASPSSYPCQCTIG